MEYNATNNYQQDTISADDKSDIKLVRKFLYYELMASYEMNALIQVVYNKEVKKILCGIMREEEKHFKLWWYFLRSLDKQQARAYDIATSQIPNISDDDRTTSKNELNGDLYTLIGEEIKSEFELIDLYEDSVNNFKGSKKDQARTLVLEILPIEKMHVEKMIRILNILKTKDTPPPRYRLPEYNNMFE